MTDVRHALILAAGRGTRLGDLTDKTPKAMIGLTGRPILDHILSPLQAAGIEEAVIITGYLAEQVEVWVGDGSRHGVKATCLRQETPGGTGEAVDMARDLLGAAPFLMTYGDIVVSPENYGKILKDFRERPCDLLLGVNWVEDPWAGAAVYANLEWEVTDIVEKPERGTAGTHWNSAGLMVMRPSIFEHTADLPTSPRGERELTDAMLRILESEGDVRGHPLEGLWSDIGTPAAHQAAERAIRERERAAAS